MALPLNDTGKEYLSWLPAWFQGDPHVQGVLDVFAREMDRIDVDWQDLLDQMFVQTATWGLSFWEQALQLPVEPTGLSDEDRRTLLMTKLLANNAQSGAAFRAVLDSYVEDYSIHMDHATGTLFIDITYNPSAYSEAQLETIIESIVPAHLLLNIQYTAFLAGISEAGDAL